jgi:hypothetical protein
MERVGVPSMEEDQDVWSLGAIRVLKKRLINAFFMEEDQDV